MTRPDALKSVTGYIISNPSHLSNREPQRIGYQPDRQGLPFRPANTTGDIARFILLFQGDQGF